MTTEVEAQRRLTSAFIMSKPTSIWPVRAVSTPDGAGGLKWSSNTAEASVVVRLDSTSRFPTTATGGRSVLYQYQLMAEWDADLQRGDRFEYNGVTYVIDDLDGTSGYQLLGTVRGAR